MSDVNYQEYLPELLSSDRSLRRTGSRQGPENMQARPMIDATGCWLR